MLDDTVVSLDIKENGRVSANIEGIVLSGYINDERLYIGDSTFYIERESKGFQTTETGNKFNKARYRRIR
ncbi:MAG: hypothetical protein L3J79_10395 [Candidatus Marinimicrobia bacterium]|nr:hypothetical protein [Candidatus Neomarinimicrobiota bacterium]